MRARHSKNREFLNVSLKHACISVLLVVCFVAAAIPGVAFSASMESLYVNGINILTEDSRTVQCGAGTATFEDSTELLTITNAEITEGAKTGTYFAGISAFSQSVTGFGGRLNLKVSGANTITVPDSGSASVISAGIVCNSWNADGINIDFEPGATLTINIQSGANSYQGQGIVASVGGIRTTNTSRGTIVVNGDMSSDYGYSIGISAKKSVILNNMDVTLNSFGTGVSVSTNDSTFRDLSLTGGTVLTLSPNSAEASNTAGVLLENGGYINVDASTLQINKNPNGKAFGTGIKAERTSTSDNSNYVIANGAVLNLNINGSGSGISLTGCDAELNNTELTITTSDDGDSVGIDAYPDWLSYLPQKVVLNGCTTNITVCGIGVQLNNDENSGSLVVDGGTFNIASKGGECILADSVSLSNVTSMLSSTSSSVVKQYGANGNISIVNGGTITATSGNEADSDVFNAQGAIGVDGIQVGKIISPTGSAFKASSNIAIAGAVSLEASSTALGKNCIDAGTAFTLSDSTTVGINSSAGNGIVVAKGDTNISNVETLSVSGTIALCQPEGETTLSTITDITVVGVENAIKNDSGNITLNNVTGFGLKSMDDVFVAEKGNVIFSGGQVNVANDAPNSDRKGLGILAKEGNILFNSGATINITGKSGGIKAEKGNIEIRDCTTVEPDTFSVNIYSTRNDMDTSEKLLPAIEASEGEINVINSRVFGHGTESEYVILAKSDITTNLAGVLYAEGGDFGIFTYGYFNMLTIDDEARVKSDIGGIVSYRYKQTEDDDTNGFSIAAGLIDYNQKRELNVKNTGWIEGQTGTCSMTTVAEQGVESIDSMLNGNDKNAWIKSGEYYTLTYKLAGGVWPLSDPDDPESERINPNPDVYKVGDDDITLIAPERDGYTFMGWTGTGLEELSKEVVISPNSGDVGSRVFTAVWSVGGDQTLLYVTSSIDRGSVTNDGETPVATASAAVGSTAVPNAGYHFVNWTKKQFKKPLEPDTPTDPDNPDTGDKGDSDTDITKAKELLYGSIANRLVPFAEDVDGGDEGDNSGDSDNDGDDSDNKGDSGDDEEEDPDEVKTDETEDVVVAETERLIPKRKSGEVWVATVFFANFEGNGYKVAFNANGGSGVMLDQDYTYGVEGKLPMTGFSNGEYIFMGWSTNPNSTKAEFADGAQVINLTEDEDATVTLYAVWALPYKGEPGTGGGGSGYNLVYGATGIAGLDASLMLGKTLFDLMGNAMPPVGDPVGRLVYCILGLIFVGAVVAFVVYKKKKSAKKKGLHQ